MEYTRFTQVLRDARITIRQLAKLLHMNPNSITNHARNGVVPDHLGAIALLIGAMAKHDMDYAGLLEQAGLRGKQPRGKSFGGVKHLIRRAAAEGTPSKASPPQRALKAASGLEGRPRFWYPADLNIPDTGVHRVETAAAVSSVDGQKPVPVTRKKRRSVDGTRSG
ncbi:MAG: hypothetical protein ACYCS8_05830 [Acidithiobacillus sp.]